MNLETEKTVKYRLGMNKVIPRGGNAIMGMRAVAGIGRSSRSQHIPIKTRTYIHLDKS